MPGRDRALPAHFGLHRQSSRQPLRLVQRLQNCLNKDSPVRRQSARRTIPGDHLLFDKVQSLARLSLLLKHTDPTTTLDLPHSLISWRARRLKLGLKDEARRPYQQGDDPRMQVTVGKRYMTLPSFDQDLP